MIPMEGRNEFNNGFLAGIIYTSAASLAILGFMGTFAYVYHLNTEKKMDKYEERIEELEKKVEKCCENNSLENFEKRNFQQY
mgnify:CR=1 FL=1